ncbi:MAG: hypothetical protein KJ672_06485 [Candidatus Thermoplasmatota archaeon]|nr:hypothetical protein [Candidatus Thermoplasmatota archaeon]
MAGPVLSLVFSFILRGALLPDLSCAPKGVLEVVDVRAHELHLRPAVDVDIVGVRRAGLLAERVVP